MKKNDCASSCSPYVISQNLRKDFPAWQNSRDSYAVKPRDRWHGAVFHINIGSNCCAFSKLSNFGAYWITTEAVEGY